VETSGKEYHPEKGAPGYWTPPASNNIPDTAGNANHSRPKDST